MFTVHCLVHFFCIFLGVTLQEGRSSEAIGAISRGTLVCSWCDSEWVIITKIYVFTVFYTVFQIVCTDEVDFCPLWKRLFFLFDQWLKMWQLPVGFKTVI